MPSLARAKTIENRSTTVQFDFICIVLNTIKWKQEFSTAHAIVIEFARGYYIRELFFRWIRALKMQMFQFKPFDHADNGKYLFFFLSFSISLDKPSAAAIWDLLCSPRFRVDEIGFNH